MSANNLPLPISELNPHLSRVFTPLCIALPEAEATTLATEIESYLQTVKEAQHRNEFLDYDLAQTIAGVLLLLLAEYATFSAAKQALIVGAVRYFIRSGDVEPDFTSILGFDDDAQVLNYVLASIDRPELQVEV